MNKIFGFVKKMVSTICRFTAIMGFNLLLSIPMAVNITKKAVMRNRPIEMRGDL